MSAPPPPRVPYREGDLPHGPGGRALAWTGALLGAVALGMGLATLLFAYAYLGIEAGGWPPPGVDPPGWRLPALATALFVASVAPAVGLQGAARRRSQAGLQASALGMVLLAAAFLAVQAVTYSDLPVSPSEHAYGSAIAVIVGAHHVFVVAGIGACLVLVLQVWAKPWGRVVSTAVGTALFWYALVGLWLLVAFTLYVSPTFLGQGS